MSIKCITKVIPGEVYELVEKACLKFDLSPREAEMLHDFLERGKTED